MSTADPAYGPEPGRWGVWDNHLREWIVPAEHTYARDAWQALLIVDSLHPWELEVREDTTPAEPEKFTTCPDCLGTGVCDSCARDCTRCDGSTEIPVEELADHERRRLVRLGYLDESTKAAA